MKAIEQYGISRYFLMLAVLGLTAFWPTLRVGFMIDDPYMIQNVKNQPGVNLQLLKSDFSSTITRSPYYRPVLSTLVRLEYSLWGERAFGYHAITLLFHIGNSILLLLIFRALGFSDLVSMITALLYSVNPVPIDDFLAATGGDSMATFTLFLTLFLFLKRRTVWGILLAFPCFFAKESNLILPVIVAAGFFMQRREKRDYLNIIGFLPAFLIFFILRSRAGPSLPNVADYLSFQFVFMELPRIIFHYIRILFLPVGLESWPRLGSSYFPPIFYPVALIALIYVTLLNKGHRRVALFCLIWFFGMIAGRFPALLFRIGLLDKWISPASPALFLPVAMLLTFFWTNLKSVNRVLPGIALSVILLFWMVVAQLNTHWRGSDEKNYRWTLQMDPMDFASYHLGILLIDAGRAGEALSYLQPIAQEHPENPEYLNALYFALLAAGHREEANFLQIKIKDQFPNDRTIKNILN